MNHPQNCPTSLRAALGGLSVLLVVAMVLQAPDARAMSREVGRGTVQRQLAEVPTKVHVRAPRRQTERPAAVHAGLTRFLVPKVVAAWRLPENDFAPRLPGVWLTDLPPPRV
ncbi:MAG: hypothetical protein GC200_04680 [Tepidisphaera sp.]|nr:hypothetical protein [Tepidisphaera sp.]